MYLRQLFGRGYADVVNGTKGGEEFLLALIAQAGNLVEVRSPLALGAFLTVEVQGKAVSLIADAA